jgi:DNA-3-methyladenine glycosylase
MIILEETFYQQDTITIAKSLLGKYLTNNTTEGNTSGIIVETEAYISKDLANHAAKGRTKRNEAMFGKPGTAYIYKIYGLYWCFNVVTEGEGIGEAVLIRALEPITGIDLMQQRRSKQSVKDLCSGPAKLVTALGISPDQNGTSLTQGPLTIQAPPNIVTEPEIITTTRIGITKDSDLPLRFYIKESPFVSQL